MSEHIDSLEKKWKGIPIMSTNMDTVGTQHKALSKYNLITCPARHYLKKILKILKMVKKIFVGLVALMIYLNYQKFLSIYWVDVANGYTIKFVDAVKQLRKMPKKQLLLQVMSLLLI